jgi:hypothetical protein
MLTHYRIVYSITPFINDQVAVEALSSRTNQMTMITVNDTRVIHGVQTIGSVYTCMLYVSRQCLADAILRGIA